MKKLLGIVVLGLLFSSPTWGRDCSIKTPNFDWSQKGWIFDGKDVYEDKGLGESFHLFAGIINFILLLELFVKYFFKFF